MRSKRHFLITYVLKYSFSPKQTPNSLQATVGYLVHSLCYPGDVVRTVFAGASIVSYYAGEVGSKTQTKTR